MLSNLIFISCVLGAYLITITFLVSTIWLIQVFGPVLTLGLFPLVLGLTIGALLGIYWIVLRYVIYGGQL